MKFMTKLKDCCVDLVLTDPPYNISRKNNFKSMGRSGVDFGEWDKDFDQLSYLEGVFRILKMGGSAVIFNSHENVGLIKDFAESNGMLYKGTIYWIKANPIPRNRDRRYVTTTENAVILVKKGEKWTFNRQRETYENGLFKYPVVSGSKRIHPTQKPVELLSDLIKIHSNKGDLVFDPFSGSGATAVACKSLERRFIGCEIDSNYYKASIERLNKVS